MTPCRSSAAAHRPNARSRKRALLATPAIAALRVAGSVLLWTASTAGATTGATPPRPAAGQHAAELCVATSNAAPSCGPAQVELRRDGSARVRIDDITYHLQLHSSQVEVVLMHGAMQIDEFTVPYEWLGPSLRFIDEERHARYEIRFIGRADREPSR